MTILLSIGTFLLQDEASIRRLVEELGSADLEARERAEAELRKLEGAAEGRLRAALSSRDMEVAQRARRLIDRLEWNRCPPIICRLGSAGAAEVVLIDSSGTRVRKIYTPRASGANLSPIWSPDGTRLAFYQYGVGVFVLGPDHQELVCVPAPHVEDEMSFQWSPDGKRILYTSDRLFENGMDGDSVKSRLVMVDAYSGKLSYPLTWGHEVRYPRWSPDGRTIVFVAGGEQGANPFDRFDLYEMDAAGGDPKRLSEDHTAKRCPVWSPDGRKIAFEWEDPIVMVSPNTGTGGIACLGIIDMRTRKAVRVTKSDRSIWRPQWSPDGQRIVLFRKATLGDDGDIVVMEPDGRNERILAKGEGSKDHVRWSPDGSKLAFCWTRDGIPQIWLVNADGTGLKKVTGELEGVIDPEWAPLR